MQKKILVVATAASALCAGAWAMNTAQTSASSEATEAGRKATIERMDQRFASHADNVLAAHDRKAAALDVGDADSFGRPVRWLGVVGSEAVNINSDCTSQDPEQPCLQIDPDTHSGSGEYRDIGSITLPAGSTHSQICHWLSPTMNAYFANYTGLDNRNARFTVFPSVTFENAALNNPALVDPNTGEPLAGKVELGVPSISIDAVLDNGEATNARNTATRTCTGGLLNKKTLIEYYGLTPRQVRDFYNNPTTIRLNMRVLASYVEQGYVVYAVRFVGD
jgi:hypothetical protein